MHLPTLLFTLLASTVSFSVARPISSLEFDVQGLIVEVLPTDIHLTRQPNTSAKARQILGQETVVPTYVNGIATHGKAEHMSSIPVPIKHDHSIASLQTL